MSQDKEPTGKSRTRKSTAKTKTPEQEQTLKIEVSRFGSIVNALSGDRWWRIVISVFLIGCVLFSGIALVAIAIKKLYPYSDITTNGLGATTIKSEKGEVSYWLFNTASLWANSGITVEEGDVITIRSSGKFHSAIHHLYDATKENTPLKDDWIDSGGIEDHPNDDSGDYQRSKFRIFPGLPSNALVMQVVNNTSYDSTADTAKGAKTDNFYFIGKERQHIYINHPGTLYFAVNDIVLNDSTIKRMFVDCLEHLDREQNEQNNLRILNNKNGKKNEDKRYDSYSVDELITCFKSKFEKELNYFEMVNDQTNTYGKQVDSLEQILKDKLVTNTKKVILTPDDIKNIIEKRIPYFNNPNGTEEKYPDRILERIYQLSFATNYENQKAVKESLNALISELKGNRAIGNLKLGVTKNEYGETVCELEYYHKKKYKTAWFDDNVGSLLIVIEKESH